MAVQGATLRALLQDVRGYLVHQGTLGCEGLDVPTTLLRKRARLRPATDAAASTKTTPFSSSCPPGAAAAPHGEAAPVPQTLVQVRNRLGHCKRCALAEHRTSIVFGIGDPKARLMFVGEAPGRDEDLLAEPFVGDSGQLLDRMLYAMGLHRGQVYIANIIKCRPPQNRYPMPEEVQACSPFVREQLSAVAPQVVVALGRLAAHTLLGTDRPISALRGQWQEVDGIALMCTYHPAYLLRAPKDKALVWRDLQEVMVKLGLPRRS